MSKYKCSFYGRKLGAIGISYGIAIEVEAENEDDARLRCYDAHEHISGGLQGITVAKVEESEGKKL